jgi:hypothetical protein
VPDAPVAAEVATVVVTTGAGESIEVAVEVSILAVVFEFAVIDDKAGFGEEFAVEETAVVLLFPFAEEFVDCAVSVRPGEDILYIKYI